MNIEHASLDIETGAHLVAITGPQAIQLEHGSRLRCAAYRFTVVAVKDKFAEPPVCTALIAGPHRPMIGMCVHLVDDALTVEEIQAAIRHLLMLPRMLLGIDSESMVKALKQAYLHSPADSPALSTDSMSALIALLRVAEAAEQATKALPETYRLQSAERYQAEVVDLLR